MLSMGTADGPVGGYVEAQLALFRSRPTVASSQPPLNQAPSATACYRQRLPIPFAR